MGISGIALRDELSVIQDTNLLQDFLNSTERKVSVNDRAHELISYFGSLFGVIVAAPTTLMQLGGLSEQTAIAVTLVRDLYRRSVVETKSSIKYINRLEDILPYYEALLKVCPVEECHIVALDDSNKALTFERICLGESSTVHLSVRDVVLRVVQNGWGRIILIHNHPSGDSAPSVSDISYTQLLDEMLRLIGAELVDHVVVAHSNSFSFMRNNLL